MSKPFFTEKWKDSFGYYEVSSLGRVRNKKTGRVLKPALVRGYHKLTLCHFGTRKNAQVHCLVLEAFAGHRPRGYECNHINGVKNDNRLENLEWVTCSQNHHHAVRLGLKRQKANQRLTNGQYKSIVLSKKPNKAIAMEHKISLSHVETIKYGKRYETLRRMLRQSRAAHRGE